MASENRCGVSAQAHLGRHDEQRSGQRTRIRHDVAAAQARECLAGAGFPVRLAEADLLRFLEDCADKSPPTGVTDRDFPETVAVVLDMARTSGFQPAALELFRNQRGFHRLFCFQPASAVTPREHSP